ncbi:MAG TPA: methyl-accepting chemotaxis protein [Bryobacteraceae bacterium]|nr:methyl-accepting chemotaxis protein [Bryobacteraceae bacterium]
MTRSWTFNQKISVGFAVVVALSALTAAIAVYALRAVVASKDRVITVNTRNLANAAKLDAAVERQAAAFRGFLLTGEGRYLEQRTAAQRELEELVQQLQNQVYTEEGKRMVEEISRTQSAYQSAQERVIVVRRTMTATQIAALFDKEAAPRRDALAKSVKAFTDSEEHLLRQGMIASTDRASLAMTLVSILAVVAVVLAALVAFLLARTLSRQIGSAVQHVQSSSTELQAAANQQASGAKESSTAMNEIATTMSELLATSRQIAESAQQVAHIAQETAAAARMGDQTVERTQDAIGSIRQQVDVIVGHMLNLGKKSQQIGAVLDIINELAEQTNILSINATIEAAGAGEAGKRFAVVGDEIRKLADRVAASTKEIRGLIDEIRSAVNTTVMATEGGSKAVDAGLSHFAEVTGSFRQITGLVTTTTDAAREIELSTKQQTTAVEQVNAAITGAAQATRETEASSSETLQTATQLASLSRELSRIIQPQVSV